MPLTVITGPPAAGKSTYVDQHAQPGDVTIDFARLADALGGHRTHDHSGAVLRATQAAWRAALDAALAVPGTQTWLIHANPTSGAYARYRSARARIVTIDPGPDIVYARIGRERPGRAVAMADAWYARARETAR